MSVRIEYPGREQYSHAILFVLELAEGAAALCFPRSGRMNGGGRLITHLRSFQDDHSGILRAVSPGPLCRRVLAGEFRLPPGVPEGRFSSARLPRGVLPCTRS